MNRKLSLALLGLAILAVFAIGLQIMPQDRHAANADSAALVDHDDHQEEDEHDDENVVRMTADERLLQGVKIARVTPRRLAEEVVVPGEVTLDQYRTSQITPRIPAQVVARHARLGDRVTKGTPLATLSSVEMAAAQGDLIVAQREWARVKKLGRTVVSERRYIEAQVAAQQAKAKVLAFGMTPDQIARFLEAGDASHATGAFDLLAPQDGTIVSDDFVVGEIIEPGRAIFEISDESVLWVEAQLRPEQSVAVTIGTPARILIDSAATIEGKVVQIHHVIDEVTRTLPVRIEVPNENDLLHGGQFVNAAITIGQGAPVVAVPENAVVLMNGAFTVFKVEGDELHPQTIDPGETQAGWVEVRSGLSPDEEIAVSGVFLLKSLILKSKMGEGHGH